MDRQEIRNRSRDLYADELRYALAREDEVDTDVSRERATTRLTREMEGQEIRELCRGMIDSVAKNVERQYVVDLDSPQLIFGGAIRTGDNLLCPVEKARRRDWRLFDEIREQVFAQHASKRDRERKAIAEIMARLDERGDDPTTLEACPDLFAEAAAA